MGVAERPALGQPDLWGGLGTPKSELSHMANDPMNQQ
jgi:hypothetical protein